MCCDALLFSGISVLLTMLHLYEIDLTPVVYAQKSDLD